MFFFAYMPFLFFCILFEISPRNLKFIMSSLDWDEVMWVLASMSAIVRHTGVLK